jgi:hypothetical protein
VKNVPGGVWESATEGAIAVNPANGSDATICWNQDAAVVGTADYEASAQFVWDMPVNIYKIHVGQQVTSDAGSVQETEPDGVKPPSIKLYSTGTFVSATVTVTGPAGSTGANHLKVGFVQNLTVTTLAATYAAGSVATIADAKTGKELASAPNTYWDTQDRADYSPSNRFYPSFPTKAFDGQTYPTSFSPTASAQAQTKAIATEDAPKVTFPRSWGLKGFANITQVNILWNFALYVVATTNESPAIYANEASTAWAFDGTGTFDNNVKFTLTGAGVTFGQQWTPANTQSPQPIVSNPRFNSIVETGGYMIVPQ